ncbi:hypothetical protein CHGG_01570 [Chaetomium globosum CBS 148.51]|uniref:Uncharacterized protein n=1 Tax=Chaetomium globosum (strain ATCC 6205 / CBS 148.51 / DSM 1962 / NBRC 6347 / NRRL 1970) TaxID=306901 RepID=Q2HDY4_CHAGB|nr:uncharacterized protein CHGG_01570 [Chaetomium globosum CBS 148.51]EAQ93335.1 hypothetical protein CHGG_01570 [Chaetomium globosum CBS 148.51]
MCACNDPAAALLRHKPCASPVPVWKAEPSRVSERQQGTEVNSAVDYFHHDVSIIFLQAARCVLRETKIGVCSQFRGHGDRYRCRFPVTQRSVHEVEQDTSSSHCFHPYTRLGPLASIGRPCLTSAILKVGQGRLEAHLTSRCVTGQQGQSTEHKTPLKTVVYPAFRTRLNTRHATPRRHPPPTTPVDLELLNTTVMDLSSNASPRSVPTPQSPAPLALSEFMAQATPCSDTTNPSDKPALSQDIPRPVGAVVEPKQPSIRDAPRAETPKQQQPPLSQETQTQDTRSPPSREDTAAPVDWLATRQQLLPRRNQGKKADWIRGWSQAVTSYGEETYCACSEAIETHGIHRGRKGKTSAQLADNVRAILQRTASPSSTNKSKPTTPATHEPEVCRLCSRPPSSTNGGNGSHSSSSSNSKLYSPGSGGGALNLTSGKRFISELLLRVRRPSSRSKSAAAHKHDAEIGNPHAWSPEDCQPPWATTDQKRFLARPPSQPVSAPVHGTGGGVATGPGASPVTTGAGAGAHRLLKSPAQAEAGGVAGGYFVWKSRSRGKLLPALAGGTNGAGVMGGSGAGLGGAQSLSSETDGTSDSDVDAQHRPLGLSRSFSRLQRAAALLQRATARSKD